MLLRQMLQSPQEMMEKTNDVFLISNSGVIKEIMDEPSEAGVQKLALLKDLEDLLLEIKTQDETRRKLLS